MRLVRMTLSRRLEIALFVAILLVAAALRLAALDAFPPGLTHDEAGHGHDAISILNGARPIYLTVGYGREPLYDYLNAAAMSVWGPSALTLRLTSAFAGILLIPIVYRLVRRWFGAPAALVAISLLAVSFWPIAVSRQALRSTLLPTLFAGAVLAFWSLRPSPPQPPQGITKRLSENSPPRHQDTEIHQVFLVFLHVLVTWWLIIMPFETGFKSPSQGRGRRLTRTIAPAVLFALLVAATLYTYIPARLLWAIFVFFLLYLAVFHRADFRRLIAPAFLGLAAAGLLAWPMFDYLAAHPGAEARLSMLDAPLQALQRGDLSVVLNEATAAIAAWFVPGRGDDFLAYTIRGRPVFDPITFGLFALGSWLCLRNLRRPTYAFLSIWLIVGVSPSLLTGNDASLTRSIGALPVFYILPALAIGWIVERLKRPRAAGVAFSALVAFTLIASVTDYFQVWGQSPDVRAAYQRTSVEIAARSKTFAGPVVVSSLYPLAPHDPYVAQVTLSLDRPPFRWFDARSALIAPPQAATLVIPASTPPDPYWRDVIGQPVERVSLRPDDLDPYFDVYRWDTQSALARALARAAPLARNFGDAIALVGVDLRTPRIRPDGAIELVTFWRVLDPGRVGPRGGPADATDAVLFTHALDATGAIVGQQDRLDAPSWSWQAGDLVAQIHRFALDEPPAPGPLSLEVGLYDRASGRRLQLIVGGARVGDSAIVATVEVTP
jgi:hypothetical protein